MSGPYTFEIDKPSGTWAAKNSDGDEISSGDLPLESKDRWIAIFSDRGVGNPVKTAMQDVWSENWDDEKV